MEVHANLHSVHAMQAHSMHVSDAPRWDARCDSDALYHQYNITMANVLDLQLAEVRLSIAACSQICPRHMRCSRHMRWALL